jgi:hypothetical protein
VSRFHSLAWSDRTTGDKNAPNFKGHCVCVWYETAGGEERLLQRVAQRNEATPAEFYYSVEKHVPQRVAPAVVGTPQRREFPREQTVMFLLQRHSKYAEHHVYSSNVSRIFL